MTGQTSEEVLEAFFASGTRQAFKRKDIIIHLAQDTTDVYWIEAGFVKVTSYNSDGSEMCLHIYKAGDIFPVTNLLRKRLIDIYFVAYSDTIVRKRRKKEVLEFLHGTPGAALGVIAQQSYIHDGVINLHLDTAEKKVIHRLINMVERHGEPEGDHYRITLPYTHQEFADGISVSRETVGKILSRLELQGCIVKGRRHTIAYPDRLAGLLQSLQ